MAVVAYRFEKAAAEGQTIFDGVHVAILAIDDAVDTTQALRLARASTVLQAAGIAVPDDYFDTDVALSTYDAAGDVSVFSGPKIYEAIA